MFEATKDPELAFLLGIVYDQQLKDYVKAVNWYENAERLGHKRVAFYLGRIYYYGLLRTKRDGGKALSYFKRLRAISRILRISRERTFRQPLRSGSVQWRPEASQRLSR